jgi:hypothetical protein
LTARRNAQAVTISDDHIAALHFAAATKSPSKSSGIFRGGHGTEMHTNQKIFSDAYCDTTMSALVDACVDPMFVTLFDGTIVLANLAACCLFWFDMEEFREQGRELIVDKTDPRLQELRPIQATGGNWVGIGRLRNKAGETFEADISATTVGARAGPHYGLIVVRDTRNRVSTERVMRDSLHRLRSALDAAEIGVPSATTYSGR